MITVQVIPRGNENLQKAFRTAIADGKIRSFEVKRVKGGLRVGHKKHAGHIDLAEKDRLLLATVRCKDKAKEWQLLEAFVGRLAYHFPTDISGINIQFDVPRESSGLSPKERPEVSKSLAQILEVCNEVLRAGRDFTEAIEVVARRRGLRSVNTVSDKCTRRIGVATSYFRRLLQNKSRLTNHLIQRYPHDEDYIREALR